MSTSIRRTALLSLSALALVATACGDDDDSASSSPVVADAWIRQPAEGTSATAAYATITNEGDEAITLVGASTPLTDTVELHETMMDDEGTMSMQEKEGGYEIAAGASLVMEPGGAHVMLLDVDPAEVTGEIELTFDFDGADDVTVEAPVEALPTSGDDAMEMDHSEHGDEMDMDEDHDHEGEDHEGEMDMESDDEMESDTTEG